MVSINLVATVKRDIFLFNTFLSEVCCSLLCDITIVGGGGGDDTDDDSVIDTKFVDFDCDDDGGGGSGDGDEGSKIYVRSGANDDDDGSDIPVNDARTIGEDGLLSEGCDVPDVSNSELFSSVAA